MQIKDLEWFAKAIEQGSLHSAADALGVTQPALTKAVRRLESTLAVRLLERTARGVAPTAIGAALYERTRVLGQWLVDTQALVQDLKTGAAGELRVGTVPALVESVLTPVLLKFLADAVPARFHVHVQLSSELLHQLDAGTLDFAIAAMNTVHRPPSLDCEQLGTQRSFVVARRGHPLHRRPFSVQDMAAYPWVMLQQSIALGSWVEQMFAQAGTTVPPAFVGTDASPAAFAALVRHSQALTVLTADSLNTAMGAGLARLPAPAQSWEVQLGLFWRRSAYFSAPMQNFRSRVRDAFDARSAGLASMLGSGPAHRR
jgi:DNA-binding transcriptional LysR family regulator